MIDTTSWIQGQLKDYYTAITDMSETAFFAALPLRAKVIEDREYD